MQTCVRESVLVSVACMYLCNWVSAKALFLCQRCLCFFCVCVCGYTCGFSVFHPSSWGSMLSGYSEGQRWHRGRGVSHHCHLSISPSLLSCILLSLSFVALGMWTLLNFPPSGWRRRQEGMRAVILSLLLSSVSPRSFLQGGLWSSGPRGEKVAQVPLPSLDTVLHNNSLIPLRSESGKEI